MTDRREFLTALSALGVTAFRANHVWARGTPQAVTAEPTIFHGHPDARTTLVRFLARGFDVPAGRLRAYGTSRRELLGTAGMLRIGDVLYGELWLQLERRRDVNTELEVPGRRGIVRHQHTLEPQPRWTIYWLTIAEPQLLGDELSALEPWRRAVRAAFYSAAGVRGNPLSDRRDSAADHLATLRLAVAARELEADFGIPTSQLALTPSAAQLDPTTVTALAGSGVRVVGILEASDRPIQQLDLPGTAPLPMISAPAIRDPDSLVGDSQSEMVARIERWLTTTAAFTNAGLPAHAVLVVGSNPARAATFLSALRSWNGRFAFPRIVVGAADHFLSDAKPRDAVLMHRRLGQHASQPARLVDLAAMRRTRDAMGQARAETLFAPLVTMLGGANGDLQALVRGIAPRFPGTLVLNSSSFTRTDIVRFEDGHEEVVTDVPGLGYAFVIAPSAGAGANDSSPTWDPVPRSESIAGRAFRLTVDSTTGAIERVSDTVGRAWVRGGSEGLNAVADAELDLLEREILANVGTRLTAHRRLRNGGSLRSTYTVYDSLPWLDIENWAERSGSSPIEYRFAFPLPDAIVSWERPAGSASDTAPVSEFVHLRWLRLEASGGVVLFRGFHTPVASVDRDGTLINMAPPGRCRFRLCFDGERSTSPGRFGWESEPLLAVPAPPGGTGLLPSAGSLLMIDQGDVSVLGMKPADDGDGTIIFLQDLTGEDRLVSLQPALMRFQAARRVDFIERDLGPIHGTLGDGILFRMAAYEIVAIRLRGLWLAGG